MTSPRVGEEVEAKVVVDTNFCTYLAIHETGFCWRRLNQQYSEHQVLGTTLPLTSQRKKLLANVIIGDLLASR